MLDRDVVGGFLDCRLKELKIRIPRDIKKEALVEAFCQYVEDDYYEWLKDNFKSFFGGGEIDWEWIKEGLKDNIAFAVYLRDSFQQLPVSARSVSRYVR